MTTKFTEEEMAVIRPIMKAYKWDNYNFLRQAALMGTNMIMTSLAVADPNSPLSKSLEPILKPFAELVEQHFEGKEEEIRSKLDPAILKKAEEDAALINQSREVFKKHDRRGPKSDPPTRGRHSPHPD